MTQDIDRLPPARLPRRTLLATGLSALTAAAIVGLVQWGQLDAPVSESFLFSRGASFAEGEEARLRGYLSQALSDDRLAVVVTGHTGSAGNAEANQRLSVLRAETVAGIARELGIPDDKITASGVGGAAPLAKLSDQSEREYQSTLSRVDVRLLVLR